MVYRNLFIDHTPVWPWKWLPMMLRVYVY
jgi:hypothetical protein